MNWLDIAERLLSFAIASMGFAVLFNVPRRTLPVIGIMGLMSGGVRVAVAEIGNMATLGALCGATVAGMTSIWAAHNKHAPPLVFAIPAVIPLVPGAYAYRTILGMVKLTGALEPDNYSWLLAQTVNNGLQALWGLMALGLGVSAPMLITRRDTAKEMRLRGNTPAAPGRQRGA